MRIEDVPLQILSTPVVLSAVHLFCYLLLGPVPRI